MTSPNPRVALGDNKPPLEAAESLEKRLDLEQAALIAEAAELDAAAFQLPKAPASDAECALLSDHYVKARKLAKRLEDARKASGKPYLDATKTINAWFAELAEPLDRMAEGIDRIVQTYGRAKAERERAERLERERVERERAEAARREEERARQEADRQAREAEEAAARIRMAADAEGRAKAEAEMREAEEAAAAQRAQAEAAAKTAAQAERQADGHERAAGGDLNRLSRIGSESATASVSKVWAYTITDARKLLATLGPLGPYLSEMTISDAVARAVREQSRGGATPTIKLPGVDIFQTDRTNIRAARTS